MVVLLLLLLPRLFFFVFRLRVRLCYCTCVITMLACISLLSLPSLCCYIPHCLLFLCYIDRSYLPMLYATHDEDAE